MIEGYCSECTFFFLGDDPSSLAGLCAEKECTFVRCKHCGLILVDHTGLNVRGGYSGEAANRATT